MTRRKPPKLDRKERRWTVVAARDDGFIKASKKEKRKNNDAPDQLSQEDFFVRVERLLLSSSRMERERESQFSREKKNARRRIEWKYDSKERAREREENDIIIIRARETTKDARWWSEITTGWFPLGKRTFRFLRPLFCCALYEWKFLCVSFYDEKRKREEKRNSLLFFSTFSLRVDATQVSLLLLGFWKKIFLLFQEDERSPGGRKSRFFVALVFRVHISSQASSPGKTLITQKETLESLCKKAAEREREEERGREREKEREKERETESTRHIR